MKPTQREDPENRSPSAVDYVRALEQAEGGAWSAAELSARAGLSNERLRQLRKDFAIVYWTDAHRQCWYPKWQFDEDHQVLPAVREVLYLLRTHDCYRVLMTFLVPAAGEPSKSPLELIRSGHSAEAVNFVRSILD